MRALETGFDALYIWKIWKDHFIWKNRSVWRLSGDDFAFDNNSIIEQSKRGIGEIWAMIGEHSWDEWFVFWCGVVFAFVLLGGQFQKWWHWFRK